MRPLLCYFTAVPVPAPPEGRVFPDAGAVSAQESCKSVLMRQRPF